MDETRVRQWHVWRRAFWARPALLVAYAVIALATVPFAARLGVDAITAGHALSAGRVCSGDVTTSCLQRVTGELEGPYAQRRTVNEIWHLWQGAREVDGFTLGPDDSDRLASWGTRPLPALLYDGQVMAVQTPDGGSVTTTLEGVSGAVQAGCLALVALAATVWFWRCGRRKRRSIGGWWRVEGPPTEIGDLPAALAAVPPGVCFLSMAYGASWQVAVAGTVVPLLLVALAAWRTWRGEVGRHAGASD